ncbi:DUF6114 domain-containing protein [Kitasatospora purpeofusca]|uniref:DUF6114 domain-containing protein n=1 Tax=Kitasatospora purpeofusca TaxID=67352 RepID=UPI00386EFF10|nr:DUF6114 domain-containing protein [Kitasatospora purpeofusca]
MSSATAEARPEHRNLVGAFWRGFRDFRRSRPFWGGLLAMIAGVPILYFPYAHLSLGGVTIAMSTTAGAGSLIIGVLLIILGLTAWFQPAVRIFAGVATTLLVLVSIPVSNLAGFGMALLPGLIGGGLMMAWAKLPEPAVAAEATTAESVATEEPAVAPAAVPAAPAVEQPAAGASVPAQQAAEPKEVR